MTGISTWKSGWINPHQLPLSTTSSFCYFRDWILMKSSTSLLLLGRDSTMKNGISSTTSKTMIANMTMNIDVTFLTPKKRLLSTTTRRVPNHGTLISAWLSSLILSCSAGIRDTTSKRTLSKLITRWSNTSSDEQLTKLIYLPFKYLNVKSLHFLSESESISKVQIL